MMRKSVWVLLVLVTLVLAACGPAMAPAATPETQGGERFMIALPRIVIDFDANGVPSMGGVGLGALAQYGVAAPSVALPPAYVNMMMAANVQHIELRQTGNGILILVNAKPLPHLGWSDEALQQAGDFAGLFNVQNTQMIKKFLPIVRRLGLDMVVRFPRAEGQAEIPLIDPTAALAVAPATGAPASAIVQFEIKYDENGVPGILGITAADLAAMGISAPLALHPAYIALLQSKNIQNMELRGKSDGLYLYVNGVPLPNIVWDDQFLMNAVDVWAQFNPGAPANYVQIARTAVPLINKADIDILVHFPLAAGAQPIAATMH